VTWTCGTNASPSPDIFVAWALPTSQRPAMVGSAHPTRLDPRRLPALTVRLLEQVVRRRVIRDFQAFGIPPQLALQATRGDRAEQYRLGERAGVVEVRICLAHASARVGPRDIVVDAGDRFDFEVRESLLREETGLGEVRDQHRPLLAKKQRAGLRDHDALG